LTETYTCGNMAMFNVLIVDAYDTWVSHMVLAMHLCVCSSCGCIRNNTQETDFGGNMGVTTGLLMYVFWMHVRFGCQQ